jgi:HAE1 family hydrophobic/amphiphilic exporter-1
MKQLGITMNLMSLMGLSTSVGTLVMNSVVVLENIFRHKNMGHSRKEAASKGTGEVAVAVIASALTNICVFVPLGTMGGLVGIFIGDFALTVVIATVFSLIIAFTLTPMLASLLLPEEQKKKMKISLAIEHFFENLEKGYAIVLEKILHNRLRSMLVIFGTIALFVVSLWAFRFIPFEFSPATDNGKIAIEVELPQDTSLEQSAALVKEVEDIAATFPEVKQIVSSLGQISATDTGTNLTKINIELIDKTMREDYSVISARLGAALADTPDAVFRVRPVNDMGGGDSSPVLFYLQGNDIDELILYTNEMKAAMARIPGATGINSSMKSGKPEINIYPNRQNLADLGVTVQELAVGVRSAVDGMVMTQLKSDGREYDIRVTLVDTDVSSYESIRNIPIATPGGIYPLSFFAEIEVEEGVNKLLRRNKQSSVEITSNLLPGAPLGNVTSEVDRIAEEILPESVTLKWGGDAEMMQETMINMLSAFAIAILLTYMVLAAILEKIGQPLLILSTVPLSLIGIIALFLIRGNSMNMPAMMAIVMLVGMVVNNAILILEYTNQLRAEGLCVRDALLKACPTKLQPILMANIATILGMLPMALGIGASGAEMRQPMGLVSIGGLLTATFLTLFVIPALENAIESKKEAPGTCEEPMEITES